MDLLDYRKNIYSQNGEDGIIKKIFSVIGTTNKFCCEFGAWDGIHFSNTHELIKNKGWGGAQIEADPQKFKDLQKTYGRNKKVHCIQAEVGISGKKSLDKLFAAHKLPTEFDLLSIDIDGLDYYILKNLKLRPRLICVEVNAGHNPRSKKALPLKTARDNVGQPLAVFIRTAQEKGYRLIGYNGNAFLLREDVGFEDKLPTLKPTKAYKRFLGRLNKDQKSHLYKVNRAWAPPWRRYHNPYLSALNLRLSRADVAKARQEFLVLQEHRRRIGEI